MSSSLSSRGINSLVKDGKAVANSVTALARAGIFIAARKGAPKPDVSSPDALKRTLLAARSISYVGKAIEFGCARLPTFRLRHMTARAAMPGRNIGDLFTAAGVTGAGSREGFTRTYNQS